MNLEQREVVVMPVLCYCPATSNFIRLDALKMYIPHQFYLQSPLKTKSKPVPPLVQSPLY